MIYECPSCRTPQEAGQTICPQCHAEFDGPVPSDAVVPSPEEAMSEAAPSAGAAPVGEAGQDPNISPNEAISAVEIEAMRPQAEAPAEPPRLTEVPTPVEVPTPAEASPNLHSSAASSSQPYLTAPSLSPLPYSAPAADDAPAPPFSRLSRTLLIAFPIVLVLVLGSVFYANSLNAGSDTVPVTLPPPTVQSSVPLPPPSAPASTPTVLQGAGNADRGADDPHTKMLVGRWVAVSGDFYLFNSDGSGSRGSQVKQQEETFLWGLVQNRIMLYRDQNEMLRFNAGPDDNTIFLAAQTGHYVQFTRSKT